MIKIKVTVETMQNFNIDIDETYQLRVYFTNSDYFTKVELELYKDGKYKKDETRKIFNWEKIGFPKKRVALGATKKVNKFSQEFAGIDVIDENWVKREYLNGGM